MSTASSFKEAGNKALQEKNYEEAIKQYTKAIEIDPNDHVFYSNRSAAYISANNPEKALEDGAKCVELNPSWAKGYSRKGAAFHAMKRYEDAKATYEAGLKHAPEDAGLKSGVAEVSKILESRNNGPPGGGLFGPQLLSKLVGHPKFGPKLADPAFMAKLQMMNTNPNMMLQDPEMMEVLQVVIGGLGKDMGGDMDTDEDYTQPFKPNPTSTSSSSSSNTQQKQEKPKEPEVPLTEEGKLEKEKKDKATTIKEKGNTLYKNKQFDEAIAAYEEAYSIDPSNVMFLNNKAAVLIEKNECDAAISLCQNALEKAKEFRTSFEDKAKIYQRIASAHIKKNDYPSAISAYNSSQMEHYDKAIERKIKNLELDFKKMEKQQYINPELGLQAKERGNVAFREGNFPDAIKEYEEACKRDPTNAAYYNNSAAALLKMGLFNDAKREVEKSLELDRNYVKAWAKKGDIEFFMKEYHKALDSYKAGLQIEPDNSLCKQGLQKTMMAVQTANYSGERDEDRAAHAMADPEIQQILADPTIRQVLQDFQENPSYAQKSMTDPFIRSKIEKLIAAGVLQVK